MSATPGRPVVRRAPGSARSRLPGWNVVLVAGAAFAVVLIIANVVVLAQRTEAGTPCPKGSVCLPPANAAGRIGTRWTSSDLQYSFEYPSQSEQIDNAHEPTPTDVHLTIPVAAVRAL